MKWGGRKSLRDAAAAARRFAAWWWSELRDIGAQLLRRLPSRQSPQIFVRAAAGSLSIERREAGEWQTVTTISAGEDGAWPLELSGIPPELAGARVALVLPEAELFYCDFELPAAAERQLGSVLRLQLERALPTSLDELAFDRQVIARDRERLTVRAAIAHRQRIETLRELMARWGFSLVSVGTLNAQGAPAYNFLKRRRDPLRWSPSPLDRRLLLAASACAGLLALVIGVQWIRERTVVENQSAELSAQASRLDAERTRLLREAQPLLALQSITATRDAPAVLAALSTAVPLGTWFNHIDITTHVDQPGKLRMLGAVAAREEVVAAISSVSGVRNLKSNATFTGNVVGPENIEFLADFDATLPKAAPL